MFSDVVGYNACTLVPTVFRWHGKKEFKCHIHFSFSQGHWKKDLNFAFCFSFSLNFEKRIWTSHFFFRFCFTLKNGYEFQFSLFVFASLWKTDLNLVFRFCIACYWKTDWSFVCHFCMNLKSGFIHQSFETSTTPPPSSPRGLPG